MPYRRINEVKLIRVQHEISFRDFAKARSIKEMLNRVPDNAKLCDCHEIDDVIVLTFEEEIPEIPAIKGE